MLVVLAILMTYHLVNLRVLGEWTTEDGVPSLPGLALAADAAGYAHGLYAALRELDGHGANLLLVERPPDDGAWIAVQDRLRRSAAGAGIDADDDAP
jgi:hypothetical protein